MDAETHELIAGYALDALDASTGLGRRSCSRRPRRPARSFARSPRSPRRWRPPWRARRLRRSFAIGSSRPRASEPQNVVSLDDRRRSRLVPALGIAAAVAAVAALAFGLWGASVSSDLDEARAALARERAAAAVLARPAAEASLTGASGRLVVDGDGRAVLVVSDVPPVPAGKTYQVWVIDDGRPVSAGSSRPRTGTLTIPVDGKVGRGSVVAVTVEDDGGASAPTGKPVIASAPVTLS